MFVLFFFFKQKTAYEMRISDWSSDVCSSDLIASDHQAVAAPRGGDDDPQERRLAHADPEMIDADRLERALDEEERVEVDRHPADQQAAEDSADIGEKGQKIGRVHV